MRVPVRIWKDGKCWLIEARCLDAMTQGHTRKEALAMLEDWVQSVLNDRKYAVKVQHLEGENGVLTVKDPKPIVALILKRNRALSGMTYETIRASLNAKSRNAFRQYESGSHDPWSFKTCRADRCHRVRIGN